MATHQLTLKNWGWIILAASLAFAIKFWLALETDGTIDVPGYQDHLNNFREFGVGAYHVVGKFGNPFNITPFNIRLLSLFDYLANITGVPFRFWLRFPCLLADAGSLFLVCRILESSRRMKAETSALVLMALSPVSILISGFHGNFDPEMIFFVVLAVYLLGRQRAAWLAGLAFGVAVSVKVAPLLFAPVFFFYLPSLRKRAEFFIAAGATFIVGTMPYILEDPVGIGREVFGYGSLYGQWGWTRLLMFLLNPPASSVGSGYHPLGIYSVIATAGKYLTLAAILIVSYLMSRRKPPPPLYLQCGVAACLFMILTPGFGSQYLCWLVPWLAGLGWRASLLFSTTGGLFLLWSYSFVGELGGPGKTIFFEVVCWASLLPLGLLFYRRSLKEMRRDALSG